jgi:hypothetical protein
MKVENIDDTKNIDTRSAVQAYLGQQTNPAQSAHQSYATSVGTNPDYEVELRRVAAQTGVPVDSARAYPDDVKRKAQLSAVDFQAMQAKYPTTVSFIADRNNAQVAHDDLDGLQGVEDTLKPADRTFLEGLWQPIASGWNATVAGFGLTMGDALIPPGLEAKRKMAAEQGGVDYTPGIERAVKQAQLERTAQKYSAPADIQQGMQEIGGAQTFGYALEAALSNPRATLETALQSLGASAPALLMATGGATLGPAGTATGAGLGSFSIEYASTVRDVMTASGINMTDPVQLADGLNNSELMSQAREKAIKRGIPIAVFDALTAGMAGRLLAGAAPGVLSGAARGAGELGIQAGGGAAGEATAQAATGEYKPGDILMEALAELPSALVEVPINYRTLAAKAQAAEVQAARIEQITKTAQASKLAQRDADTFEKFVAAAKEEGPVQDVYIDAQALMQSGVAEQVAAASPAVADQLPAAAATGGVIRIPVEEYAARIAPTELSQSLIDHLRTEPEGFSRAEAQQFMQTQQEQLQNEMEKAVKAQEGDAVFKTERDAIAAQVRDQLDTVGRFSPEVHSAYATMIGNFFAVQGAKLGVSPQELFNRTGFSVAGSMADGPQLEATQGQPLQQAETLRAVTKGLKDSGVNVAATERDGAINLAKIVVPETERSAGKGTAAMQALLDYADRTGQRIELTPSADFGGNKKRLIDFYKRLGFVENKGAAKDFTISEAMYRPAQQAKTLQQADLESEAFKNWFGDSKVADAEGKPLVVYHGTGSSFTEFDTGKIGRAHDEGYHGAGFYFSQDPEYAGAYTPSIRSGGNIMPVYLALRNPYVKPSIATHGDEWRQVQSEQDIALGLSDESTSAERTAALKKAGYDGVVVYREKDGNRYAFEAVAFDPSQIKSAIGNRGTFDPNNPNILEQKARGMFNPETNVITLLKNADLSTFLHESGHFFLEQQFALTNQLGPDMPAAQQELAKDTQALLNWFGVQDLDTWYSMDFEEQRSYHEKFAQGFEKYLFEGKAPSIELQPLFQRFAAWLKSIYRDLTRLKVELTPEVRGVLDRMLATNEQITLAEQARSMMPLFETPEKAGMAPEEFAAYQAQDVEASADAIQDMQARGLRDMQYIHNARGREIKRLQKEAQAARTEVRMEVAKQVMAEPVYQAWQFLTGKPTQDDAESVMNYGKLDLETLREGAQPEVFEKLKTRRMTRKDGLHPDVVAEKFGFASGDELTRALAETSSPGEEIEGITDRVMLERYGELATPEAIEKAADKAIHNTVRGRMLATEANALARMTGQRKVLMSAAKELAGKLVGRLKIADLRPQLYVTAEGKAGRAAEAAFRKGDTQQAAAEKRNQLVNHELARTAYDAQDEVIKIDRFFKRIVTTPDDKLKSRDMDVVNAARAVLASFGYGAKAKNAAEYLSKVQEYDPAMYEVLAASVVAAQEIAQGDVKQLTVDQLRALNDEVSSLWYLSKRVRQMEIDGDLMDREDVAEQLQARMVEVGLPSSMPGEVSAVTPDEERSMRIASVKAVMRRVESWADMMDGSNKMGVFRRYLWTPIKEAADQYRADRVSYLRQFRDTFSDIAQTMKRGQIVAPELNYTFGKDSAGVAMNEILHAILHTGNASNKRKLLLGRGWAQEQPDGTLDTSRWDAFINRMVAEGKLVKEHFDFAQRAWDLLEQTKPLAQKAHRAAYGKYFDEVTAEAFTDPFGVVRRGGYVPAQVDSRIVKDNELKKLIEEGKEGMAYAFPGTSKGFTKSRTEYNRPLLLDLRTLPQHIDKVLLFSHMELPSRDAAKLLYTKGLSSSLNKFDPAAITGMLMPWLNRSARQQVTTPIAGAGWMMRMLNTLRNRTSMATMFANISNTAQQITGFSLAALKVRPSSLAASTAAYLRAPKRTAEEVAELSVFMRNRMSNEVDAMMGEIQGILLDPNAFEKAQEWAKRHTYFMQSAFDNVMGPIIWRAAYSEALEQNFDTKDAVRIADATIRQTQGSTMPEDVSRIETGPAYARLFTQFVGYFNMQANLLGTEFAKMSQEMGVRKGMGRGLYITLLGFYIPAMVAELVAQAFRGGPGDDDKDGDYLDDWLMATLVYGPMRNATAFVPFAGQVINSAVARFNGNPNDDKMSMSPAVSSIEAAVGVPFDLYKIAIGEGNAQRTVKDVATLISLTTGIPASVAARPISYLAGIEQRTIQPTSAPDLVRGLATGAASPESKGR